jgi:hypothetical protein
MTAATQAPVRPVRARAARLAPPLSFLRLLRIELRRSAMPWLLPLIAALFWFDSYRPSTGQAPLYVLRTFWNMGQGHTIIDFGPWVAGVAAWMGSRDGRRRTADLVAGTALPRWTAQLATWAATAIWAVAAYLVFTCVMFAVYASQGVQGQPPWWWVAVGATAVAAFSAAGFAVGVFWPSRFAAPLAAFGGFLALIMSSQTGFHDSTGWALILPTNSNGNFQPDSGLLYPWLPDLQIARIMLLAGIAIAALGLLGLRARGDGPWLRWLAVAVTAAGVAAAGTAVGLATTARLSADGIVIPALHDAASDRPFSYTPVCGQAAGISVCLSPYYGRWRPEVTAALGPVFSEMAGLPGAPVRATQVGAVYNSDDGGGQSMTIGGRPVVLSLSLGALALSDADGRATVDADGRATVLAEQLRLLAVHAFVGAGNDVGTSAQQAVQAALLQDAGVPFSAQPQLLTTSGLPSWAQAAQNGPPGPATGPVYAAARRLAALSPGARHAWLAAHLTALRSGQLTLGLAPITVNPAPKRARR